MELCVGEEMFMVGVPGLGVFLAPRIRVELASALAQESVPVDCCHFPVG